MPDLLAMLAKCPKARRQHLRQMQGGLWESGAQLRKTEASGRRLNASRGRARLGFVFNPRARHLLRLRMVWTVPKAFRFQLRKGSVLSLMVMTAILA